VAKTLDEPLGDDNDGDAGQHFVATDSYASQVETARGGLR
jgi:hypothetical protein